jgi:hypothetical protein
VHASVAVGFASVTRGPKPLGCGIRAASSLLLRAGVYVKGLWFTVKYIRLIDRDEHNN